MAIESVFGLPGLILDKYLRLLNWVYLFQDISGIFPPLNYYENSLQYEDNLFFQEKECKRLFTEELIDFCCGPIDEVPKEGTLFHNVCSSEMAHAAMHLFFVFRTSSEQEVNEVMKVHPPVKFAANDSPLQKSKKVHMRFLLGKVNIIFLYYIFF